MNTTIYEFSGQYRFLSNFWLATFTWEGIMWPHSEAAYQAAKFSRDQWHEFAFMTPSQAKKEGQIRSIRDDWNEVRVEIMRSVVSAKFEQNPSLMSKLVLTGEARLEEGNTWKDRFWGICPPGSGNGENHLGQILMDIRAKECNSLQIIRKRDIINYDF